MLVSPLTSLTLGGRYRIEALLGQGGMGVVYRAHDLELDEQVALKVLHETISRSAQAIARFRREVKLARRVTHPNVARTFDIGDLDREPADLGRELDVELLVEGSLRRQGEQVVVTVRVLSVADGFQLWSRRFERPAAELLLVADDVARAIAASLGDSGVPTRLLPSHPRALDLFLRGRHEYQKTSAEAWERAEALFREALALDPDDVALLASHALAEARLQRSLRLDELGTQLLRRSGQAGAGLAEPLVALAELLRMQCRWVEAARSPARLRAAGIRSGGSATVASRPGDVAVAASRSRPA